MPWPPTARTPLGSPWPKQVPGMRRRACESAWWQWVSDKLLSTPAHLPPCLPQALAEVQFGRSERAVRVNAVQSGTCREDLEAVLTGPALPDAIVVPKVGAAAAVEVSEL